MIWYCLIALIVIVIDQLVKWLVVTNISLGETIFHTNGILSLTHIRNTGAAWSILEGQLWFFFVITVITVGIILYFLKKNLHESKWLTIGLSLVLGGALGNFIDRMRLGYVVDMFQIDFVNFPIFNIADTALTIGVFCIMIYLFIEDRKQKEL